MQVKYLNNEAHPITITVIGAGGTGSQVMNQLARMNYALKKLGREGLHVILLDPDRVTEANCGRQLFAEQEIGDFKANAIVTRLNRFYGTEWESKVIAVTERTPLKTNVVITCTDTKASRLCVQHRLKQERKGIVHNSESKFHYWLDIGNTKDSGQIILGSVWHNLKTVVDRYPKQFADKTETDTTPSCSLAEALEKQDLFINSFMANVACKLLWEMMTSKMVDWCGAYVNLKTLNFKKIAA